MIIGFYLSILVEQRKSAGVVLVASCSICGLFRGALHTADADAPKTLSFSCCSRRMFSESALCLDAFVLEKHHHVFC